MKTDRECVSVMNFNPLPPCFKLVYTMNKCKLLKICVCEFVRVKKKGMKQQQPQLQITADHTQNLHRNRIF